MDTRSEITKSRVPRQLIDFKDLAWRKRRTLYIVNVASRWVTPYLKVQHIMETAATDLSGEPSEGRWGILFSFTPSSYASTGKITILISAEDFLQNVGKRLSNRSHPISLRPFHGIATEARCYTDSLLFHKADHSTRSEIFNFPLWNHIFSLQRFNFLKDALIFVVCWKT